MKIILHLNAGSDGYGALLAAKRLTEDGHQECIYTFASHEGKFLARRNQASISVWEDWRDEV